MGIKLDWEVESEGGWNEVGEDPRAIEARRRQARRMRNGLLAALAAVLVVGSIVAYRLFRVGQQVREALKAAVAAETLALRIGDREAYLEAQSRLGGWHQIQEQTFRKYQAEGTSIEVTGQILEMDISANQARVTLRESIDGKTYHVMWFYQRDEANGWKHIAPSTRFWGDKQEHHSTYFDFDYYSEDQALVDALSGPLDDWWEAACDLTQCVDKPTSLDVKIEPDPLAEIGWAQYDANTLIIPSPLLGRFPADGKPDPALTSQLTDRIAYRWAEYLVGKEVQPYSEVDWLRSEVHWWLRHSFDPAQPPAPLLTPLVQAYGKQIVPPLIERIQRGDPVVPVLQDLTRANAADLPVGWELYLTNRLWAEASLLQEGKETEAMLLYRDPERLISDAAADFAAGLSDIDAIQVTGLRRYGDLVWAETVFTGVSSHITREIPSDTMTTFLPFRLLSDRWVRTTATGDDLGPAREDRGEHVIVRYYDIDVLTVAGLQASLDQTYNQIVADVGDPADLTGVPVFVLVEIGGPGIRGDGFSEEELTTHWVYALQIPSPYLAPYVSKGTLQEAAQLAIMPELIRTLVGLTLPSTHPLRHAFQQWELSRLGIPIVLGHFSPPCQPPGSLEFLWSPYVNNPCDDIAATVLLDLLVEQHGEEVVARLISSFSQASSMDDWLYRSLGIHAADIEAEWIERVRVELNGMP